jgi:hypothetical protein
MSCFSYRVVDCGLKESLRPLNAALTKEYHVRQEMLLKRLDVTVQAFNLSPRAQVDFAGYSHLAFSHKVLFFVCGLGERGWYPA